MPHEEPLIPKPEQITFFERQVTEAKNEIDKINSVLALMGAQVHKVNTLLASVSSDEDFDDAQDNYWQARDYWNQVEQLNIRFLERLNNIDLLLGSNAPYEAQVFREILTAQQLMSERMKTQIEAFAVTSALLDRTFENKKNN